MARTHARSPGEGLNGKIRFEVSDDPSDQITKALSRMALKLVEGASLSLFPEPGQVHHEIIANRTSDVRAVIVLNKSECEIDSRGKTGGGIKGTVSHKTNLMVYFKRRKSSGHIVCESPVGRDFASIE